MRTTDNGGSRLDPALRNIIGFCTANYHNIRMMKLETAQNIPQKQKQHLMLEIHS